MKDFRDLDVWKKAHRFTLTVYKETAVFPTEELYGLTRQLRKAAASIPTNIAEGCGRGGNPELAQFLQYAMGSASEAEYLLLLSRDLLYLGREPYGRLDDAVTEIKRMLASLIKKIRRDIR